MQALQLIRSQPETRLRALRSATNSLEERPRSNKPLSVDELPRLTHSGIDWNNPSWLGGTGEFFKGLSIKARRDFERIATHFHCPGSTVLIREEQVPSSVLLVIAGRVRLSMNSFDGRRILLTVAGAGDLVGLASAVSGGPSGIMAECIFPSTIAAVHRQDFLAFQMRHPIAAQNVMRELTFHYSYACDSLRIIGLTISVKAKLASLILKWCKGARHTESGAEIRCILTHGEIGEYIGISRESVTRAMTDFKGHDLVKQRGATLIIPDPSALAFYARVESVPHPTEPAA